MQLMKVELFKTTVLDKPHKSKIEQAPKGLL